MGSVNRMWLDDKHVVDDRGEHDAIPTTISMRLENDRRYTIKIEYSGGGFGTRLVELAIIANPVRGAVLGAKPADGIIAVVGITSRLEGEEMKVEVPGFKGGDRTSLDLPKEEEELLHALGGTGKPVVVVL